ncbi:hypothetical protein LHV16_05665 [Providencia rettgeri]|uniref:DUF7279 family protein n=1 Tax=Providencia rettgeri TaxID=587 RepID=UPI001B35A3DD|nr:hypothetical protein [Providencia rettgeri]MCB4826719.1 hypothetical protein [Providencia rettgeri]MCG9945185.1 hypothetical protein [Providencia rettgeri]
MGFEKDILHHDSCMSSTKDRWTLVFSNIRTAECFSYAAKPTKRQIRKARKQMPSW